MSVRDLNSYIVAYSGSTYWKLATAVACFFVVVLPTATAVSLGLEPTLAGIGTLLGVLLVSLPVILLAGRRLVGFAGLVPASSDSNRPRVEHLIPSLATFQELPVLEREVPAFEKCAALIPLASSDAERAWAAATISFDTHLLSPFVEESFRGGLKPWQSGSHPGALFYGDNVEFIALSEESERAEHLQARVFLVERDDSEFRFLVIKGMRGSGKSTFLSSFVDEISDSKSASVVDARETQEYFDLRNVFPAIDTWESEQVLVPARPRPNAYVLRSEGRRLHVARRSRVGTLAYLVELLRYLSWKFG